MRSEAKLSPTRVHGEGVVWARGGQEDARTKGKVQKLRVCGEALIWQGYNRCLQNHPKREVLLEALFPRCERRKDCSWASSSGVSLQRGPGSTSPVHQHRRLPAGEALPQILFATTTHNGRLCHVPGKNQRLQ